MAGWLVTGAGDTWTVKFDVRDLGGNLDFTILCTRTDGVVCRAPVVCAFPLDFEGVSFGFFVPCLSLLLCVVLRLALYQSGVLVGLVRLSFVLPGLVFCLSLILELSSPLLDGPLGSDPAFHVVSA